ncbi:MAG TPA: protein kinase [Vicinamibacterales bacterium]|nr:protein kinase [Vicinamibacterales bacterium]
MTPTLAAGSRLGPYEIRAPIGAGGMGEVYRAHDAKLDRDVAIKILPPALAADPDALVRFEREARAVAGLSHPHILAIHDFGRESATVYAVMELLEGQTLRERLRDGALPVRKAIDMALQIAQGLAAAHEKGIVHRDLKPENVFVSTTGRVKILDFGLAKAIQVKPDAGETVAATPEASTPGMVVGTVGYMSPEQVTGGPVDHRTDIFAFGALVYEMLTGRPAFVRASSAETIAAILREDVAEVTADAGVPQALERILRRCLEKRPAERFYSAHDVGIALEAFLERSSSASASVALAPERTRTRPGVVIIASAIAAGVITLAAVGWFGRGPGDGTIDRRVRKFHVPAQRLVLSRETRPIISPDGEKIAFVAGDSLWIQELNQLDARQLAQTWRPRHLFWSPDSAFVGFVAENKLWKVPVNGGGQPIALAEVPRTGGGASGAWRADGKIVFSPSVGSSGLLELSQDGGETRPVAALQTGDVDFHEPALLPDDNGQLLVIHRTEGPDTIAVIRDGMRKDILRLAGEYLVFPQYSSTGHIVFGRAGKAQGIWAVPFDPATLATAGEPFLVAAGAFFPSLSRDGTLTFIRRIWSEPRQLVIVNRAGAVERAIGEPQPGLGGPVIAPDGRRVAVVAGAAAGRDVWIQDLQIAGRRRLTFLESDVMLSAWTANNRVVFTYSVRGRLRPVMSAQPADGRGAQEDLGDGCCGSFSNDGTLVYTHSNDTRESDMDLFYRGPGDAAPKVLLDRPGSQESPTVSPDGAYVAYQSNESGRYEVYVRPFPAGAGQWQVSLDGGTDARWSARGDKLWFRAYGNILMEVDVKSAGGAFAFGEPREVFKGDPIAVDLTLGFAVLANGERFIAARRVADPDGSMPSITVVQNWFAEFADRR